MVRNGRGDMARDGRWEGKCGWRLDKGGEWGGKINLCYLSPSILLSCFHDILISWYPVILISCYHVIMLSCYPVILFSWYPVILLSCYPVILLSCYPIILLSCYPVILLSCYPVILLSCYPIILLSCYSIINTWQTRRRKCLEMNLEQGTGGYNWISNIMRHIHLKYLASKHFKLN